MKKKILLICNSSNTVISFRKSLIAHLKLENEVHIIAFDDLRKDEIKNLGATLHIVNDENRSTNVFKILTLKQRIAKIIKNIRPDIVMTFVLKPNIFGVLAAQKAGVKEIYSMVEGAGDVFINNSLKWKIIRKIVCFLYKKAFKNSIKVFFLNDDDKEEFIKRKLVDKEKCIRIKGIGVDLDYFEFKDVTNTCDFLMIARMLKTKGVLEYCECARIVKQKYPHVNFNYLGAEGTIKLADVQQYIDDGSIKYLGVTKDVRPYIENSLLFVLPSYREGMPMAIMEAEAIGRAIVTYDSIGCKDTVVNGYNGFIVPKNDYKKMAEKIIWCIEHLEETKEMCANSRKFAEENFDEKKINEFIINTIM